MKAAAYSGHSAGRQSSSKVGYFRFWHFSDLLPAPRMSAKGAKRTNSVKEFTSSDWWSGYHGTDP